MTHNQRESEEKGRRLREEREELLEKTRKVREARQQQQPTLEDETEGQVPRPPTDDPRHTDPTVPASQTNVPAGGTTGSLRGGGTANRRKNESG